MIVWAIAPRRLINGTINPREHLGHNCRICVHTASLEDLHVFLHEPLHSAPGSVVTLLCRSWTGMGQGRKALQGLNLRKVEWLLAITDQIDMYQKHSETILRSSRVESQEWTKLQTPAWKPDLKLLDQFGSALCTFALWPWNQSIVRVNSKTEGNLKIKIFGCVWISYLSSDQRW